MFSHSRYTRMLDGRICALQWTQAIGGQPDRPRPALYCLGPYPEELDLPTTNRPDISWHIYKYHYDQVYPPELMAAAYLYCPS